MNTINTYINTFTDIVKPTFLKNQLIMEFLFVAMMTGIFTLSGPVIFFTVTALYILIYQDELSNQSLIDVTAFAAITLFFVVTDLVK